MSISNKSVNRINKAVETQKLPSSQKENPNSKTALPNIPLQKDSFSSGITQKLPDYLL